jgi:hypothetical protein
VLRVGRARAVDTWPWRRLLRSVRHGARQQCVAHSTRFTMAHGTVGRHGGACCTNPLRQTRSLLLRSAAVPDDEPRCPDSPRLAEVAVRRAPVKDGNRP